jgi:hypothetical protein
MVSRKTITVLLGSMCLAVLGAILVAGLWPFNPRPANEVKWLNPENGLEFGQDGTIFTEGPIRMPPSSDAEISLDIWVQASIEDIAPILSFDQSRPARQFRVLQYGDTLLLQKTFGTDVVNLEVEHSLKPLRGVFFTIAADRQQTSVYVNGVLAKTSTHVILAPDNLSGRLVAGSQPFDYDSWAGQLRWLAIYRRRLTASQAAAHYQSWINGSALTGSSRDPDDAVVLYRFDEHRGNVVHNTVAGGPNLLIPKAFTILDKTFLEAPWPATLSWSYFQDIAINIFGFIPLGFFVCAFLNTRRPPPRISVPWATIIFGTALSLAIEVLQVFLPTRDSSLTDVISNTLGTVIGVALCGQAAKRILPWLASL